MNHAFKIQFEVTVNVYIPSTKKREAWFEFIKIRYGLFMRKDGTEKKQRIRKTIYP